MRITAIMDLRLKLNSSPPTTLEESFELAPSTQERELADQGSARARSSCSQAACRNRPRLQDAPNYKAAPQTEEQQEQGLFQNPTSR